MSDKDLERQLKDMVSGSAGFMSMLQTVRELQLESWCIGAGAIRSLVWDRLHNFAPQPASGADVDVVYYDNLAAPERDAELSQRLFTMMPSVLWEVTNQANVHHWFFTQLSQVVRPFDSLADGIATWPEYATCVGVTLNNDDSLEITAPHGLEDLFSLRLRHNPLRAPADVFQRRLTSKRFIERWPLLSICPA